MTFQVSDHPLRSIQLVRDEADDEDDAAATREILAAVTDLARGWLEPLGVAIRVECCDPDDYMQVVDAPAAPHCFLRKAPWPVDLVEDIGFSNAQVREQATLDGSVIADAVATLVRQGCPRGVTSFGELLWTAVNVRMPIADLDARYGKDPVDLAPELRDGAAWVLGPTVGPAAAPVRLRAANEHGTSRILLSIQWSIWVDRPAIVDEAVGRVLARDRGWHLT